VWFLVSVVVNELLNLLDAGQQGYCFADTEAECMPVLEFNVKDWSAFVFVHKTIRFSHDPVL
jgi:hypothetical protein